MKPTVEALQNSPRYTLLAEVPHDELLPFVQLHLRERNPVTKSYIAVNLLTILGAGIGFGVFFANGTVGLALQSTSIGLLLSFTLLIVLHEWIHGLVYRWLGANHVSYGGNWRKLVFYAVADRFVADRADFVKVALAPFVVINLLAITGILLAVGPIKGLFMAILLLHTAFCSGDFALLSFLYKHRDKEVFTYDDVPQRISFFYAGRRDTE